MPSRNAVAGKTTVRPVALLLIDIDHFKETNDRFGHALGDAVLVEVAGGCVIRCARPTRSSVGAARNSWSSRRLDADRLDELATRILHRISAEPIILLDKRIRTTASVGYVPIPLPPSDIPLPWDSAIGLVDMALYMAKANGRNRAYGIRRFADSDPETLAAAERDLEHASKAGLVDVRVQYGPSPTSGTSTNAPLPRALRSARSKCFLASRPASPRPALRDAPAVHVSPLPARPGWHWRIAAGRTSTAASRKVRRLSDERATQSPALPARVDLALR